MAECWHGHRDCTAHAQVRPDLYALPRADPPRTGRCRYGHVGHVWVLPADDKPYCARCLRVVLRVRGYPIALD